MSMHFTPSLHSVTADGRSLCPVGCLEDASPPRNIAHGPPMRGRRPGGRLEDAGPRKIMGWGTLTP